MLGPGSYSIVFANKYRGGPAIHAETVCQGPVTSTRMIIMGFNQLRAKQGIYIHMRFLCSEKRMSKYTLLINWTEQGIRNVKDTIKREKSFEDAVQKAGGKSLGFYYTIGRYDMVAMVEAPTDETMASILLSLGHHLAVIYLLCSAMAYYRGGAYIIRISTYYENIGGFGF
jgi:uncharacterized protein with GYD domain